MKEKLPIGIGATELQKGRETLPVVEVDNEVFWINPAFEEHLPFNVGERYDTSKLGIFLTSGAQYG